MTPAGGVVLGPVTNFATHDRDAGTVTVNSSIGAWKKLERIRHNPRVALAFHTREHGFTDRPEYVLVQGTASLSEPIADYPATYAPHTRFGYRLPPSTLLYRLVVGLAARRGLRTARKAGVSMST